MDTKALKEEQALAGILIKILNSWPKAATVLDLLHHQDEDITNLQHTVNCWQQTQFHIQQTWIFTKILVGHSNRIKPPTFPLYSRHILSLGDIFSIPKHSVKFCSSFLHISQTCYFYISPPTTYSRNQSITDFVVFFNICLMHCSVFFVPLVFRRTSKFLAPVQWLTSKELTLC